MWAQGHTAPSASGFRSTGDAPSLHPADASAEKEPAVTSNAGQNEGKGHQCPICQRSYERRDHLSRHIRSHNDERTHVCQDCGKGFTRADLLSRHRVIHFKDGASDNGRRRTPKACQACIAAKTKCMEQRPCERCKARNEPCVPTQAKARALGRDSISSRTPTSPTLDNIEIFQNGTAPAVDSSAMYGFVEQQQDPLGGDLSLSGFEFPDFFDQIMNLPAGDSSMMQNSMLAPPDITNFTSDDLGPMDFDFGFLAGGLTRPPSVQGNRQDTHQSNGADTSPQSDAQLRSEAFEKSPWSWNHWIPEKTSNTFSGQEITAVEERISTNDQLTPGSNERQLHCVLELEGRDRILRMVTQTADSRLAVLSFPSLELLNDLMNVFVLQESCALDSYVHWASLDCRQVRTEALLAMVAKGATFIALRPVWKIGLVFQEIVRMAIADTFEQDNSTTRQLQPLQAYMLSLDIGMWSGFRRKTELASSFLQPAATILTWSNAFARFRYKDIEPTASDDAATTEMKWKEWTEQESLKRLVLHTFIHDSQAALAHLKNPLLTPSRMQLPLPLSADLWRAPDAQTWKHRYLATSRSKQSDLPSVMELTTDIQLLSHHAPTIIDKPLCILLACHLVAYDVLQFRQQAAIFAACTPGPSRRDRWLAHAGRQKDLYDDLLAMHSYCEMQSTPVREAIFLLQYLMTLLHVSLDDIQLFSGRSGEAEARRVYPLIKTWTQDAESRTAVWHAGQAVKAARSFEQTRLRDFYAVSLHHVFLTVWVYGMVRGNVARMSRVGSPARGTMPDSEGQRNGQGSEDVVLDGEDDRRAMAFRRLGQGRACLSKVHGPPKENGFGLSATPASMKLCPLKHSKGVMILAAEVFRANFPNSSNGLPPLVDNIVKLMTELARLSGKSGT